MCRGRETLLAEKKCTIKMDKCSFILCLTTFMSCILASDGGELLRQSICPWMFYRNSTCSRYNFRCLDGKCIDHEKYCNGKNDCVDRSDEEYCSNRGRSYFNCPSNMIRCQDEYKCIPYEWLCDGVRDCNKGQDERNCDRLSWYTKSARAKALLWVSKQNESHSATEMWGPFVDKLAVLLHLGSNISTNSSNETRKDMAYEISIQLLSRLSKRRIQDIPSSDLASYLNAFLVTCLDPRKFHGMDIVRELRSRVDGQNSTNPYVILSLCNAGETITASDNEKLLEAFRAKRWEFWTDVQAFAVMALACASRQPGSDVDTDMLRELILELKQLQYRNGTVENLQTTALVIQTLLSAEAETDPDNFDHKRAMEQILEMQEDDGSFGSFQNTYYVLPLLNCQSLVNISSDHCERLPPKRDEKSALEDLVNKEGPKVRVRYSLWIGDGRDLERNLALKVPANTSFYGIMEMAAEIDSRYRVEYVVKNRKPYVKAISSYQDDPERGMFWYFSPVVSGQRVLSRQSPADIIAKDNEHFVMWYRSEAWLS